MRLGYISYLMLIYPIDTGGVMDALGIAGLIQTGTNIFQQGLNNATSNRDFVFTQENIRRAQEREDNAIQRRAADLKAAGLNPLLAVGSPASSAAPIRAGGQTSGSGPDIVGPIVQAGKYDIDRRLAQETLESARASRLLTQMQAAKTEAEKAQVEASTELMKQQAVGTSASTELTNRNITFTDKKIENAIVEKAQIIANTNKVSVETAFRELEKRIAERDQAILEKLGLMNDPPSGATGQAGQVGSVIFDKIDKAVDRIKSGVSGLIGPKKKERGLGGR